MAVDPIQESGEASIIPPAPGEARPRTLVATDKLDTLTGFFAAGIRPTGGKDPFALRRAGLGLIRPEDRNLAKPMRVAILRINCIRRIVAPKNCSTRASIFMC